MSGEFYLLGHLPGKLVKGLSSDELAALSGLDVIMVDKNLYISRLADDLLSLKGAMKGRTRPHYEQALQNLAYLARDATFVRDISKHVDTLKRLYSRANEREARYFTDFLMWHRELGGRFVACIPNPDERVSKTVGGKNVDGRFIPGLADALAYLMVDLAESRKFINRRNGSYTPGNISRNGAHNSRLSSLLG